MRWKFAIGLLAGGLLATTGVGQAAELSTGNDAVDRSSGVTAAACNPLPVSLPSPAVLRQSKKKVFAFYFPPFPISIDNKSPSSDYYSRWQYSYNSQGGAYDLRDRPIGREPLSRTDWKQADFETEIRRAIQVGIDGFIFEFHDSSDQRWMQLPTMLAAAQAVDPGFRIVLSPDFPTTAGAAVDPVVKIVSAVASHPSVYRLDDGRVPLAPFYPERQPVSWWNSVHDALAAKGVNTALVPIFLDWGGGSTQKTEWNSSVYGYSTWGTRWVSGLTTPAKESAEAHTRGRIYMQPIAFEDTRSYDGRYWESSNSELLRKGFETAISANADWVSLTTWNDYTESWLSPSQERGYSVTDVASYYIYWFKTGQRPTVTQDALYWFHRSQRTDAPFTSYPIGRNGSQVEMAIKAGDPASNQVELVAFLTQPGTLVITQGSDVRTLDAAAGVVSFKVPMVPGTTPVFQLKRSGSTVKTVTSDTKIQASVTYQDMMYHGGGGITGCARP